MTRSQVGDKCDGPCSANNQYQADREGAGEGIMTFYEGSKLCVRSST
jgi:hypothetical protein